jgi:hypothetical protein
MADQPSSISTAAKPSKKKNFLKGFRDLIKRPKSANAAATPSNLHQGSVSSASGAHVFPGGNATFNEGM